MMLREGDSVPVPRARVLLHRIGRQRQGPIDSVVGGGRGEFSFRFHPDTSAVFLVSASFAGIEYFSSPLHAGAGSPDTGLALVVSDTSSTGPIGVDVRHLVVSRPTAEGRRPVLEIVALVNSGERTRIARDSTSPSWAAPIPPGVGAFQPGASDVSPEALVTRHDSVLLFAPVAPGEKQLVFSYTLPPGPRSIRIPVADSIPAFDVLLEEANARASGGTIAEADTQQVEGHTFRQWIGMVRRGDTVEIRFGTLGNPRLLLPALVALVGLGLVTTALVLLRRRPAGVAPSGAPEDVLSRLAKLDARYAGRAGEVPPEEWQQYRTERARLKSELESSLAGRGRPS
jgi:hypothetical protein